MPALLEQLRTRDEAVSNRWVFVGVYPQPDQPILIHSSFARHGYKTADLPFDAEGNQVEPGQYALWVKFGSDPKLASCGCVNHAEEGIPCIHDLELALSR